MARNVKSKVKSSKLILPPRRRGAEFEKFFLCASAPLRLIFAYAEVDQVHPRHPAAAGLRRGGARVVARAARGLRRGHGLDSAAGRRGLLGGDFSAAAEADVDLRSRP